MAKILIVLGIGIIAIGSGIGAIDIFGTPQLHDKMGGYGALKLGWFTVVFGLVISVIGLIALLIGKKQ